jgi:hypothetical protein
MKTKMEMKMREKGDLLLIEQNRQTDKLLHTQFILSIVQRYSTVTHVRATRSCYSTVQGVTIQYVRATVQYVMLQFSSVQQNSINCDSLSALKHK